MSKEMEQKMVKALEDKGLYRKVHHDVFLTEVEHKNKRTGEMETIIVPDPQMVSTLDKRRVMAIGATTVIIVDKDDKEVGKGQAVCSVSEKNFNRKVGRLIATGRAIKDTGMFKREKNE